MMMNDLIAHIDFELKAARVGAHKIHDSTKAVLEACKEALQSQWVSAEDGLPETEVPVLCWHPFWSMQLGWLDANNHLLIGLTGDAATHWMPLPTPPAKEQGS
jgi:hypothetical protein